MNIHVISLLFVLLCGMARGQTLTVTATDTGEPLEFVRIMSAEPKILVYTDELGQANIEAFRGVMAIEMVMIGYQSVTLSYDQLANKSFTAALKPLSISLGQAVVSGTRWNQSSLDQPAMIRSIRTREVILQNPQTAADLLGANGDVFIQKSQQGGGSPMIRGFATNRLLYSIDGIRMNTAIFRGGNIQNVISLDPFTIENTEVLFGPGSVLYGSDAVGGVMAFTTLRPRFSSSDEIKTSGKAVVRYASANGEQTAHFSVNAGSRRWAALTSFTTSNYGDLRMGRHGPADYLRLWSVSRIDSVDRVVANTDPLVQAPTGYEQLNLMQKIRFAPGGVHGKLNFDYAFHYSTTTDNPRYDRLIELRNGVPREAEWYYGPQVWMMNSLSIDCAASNRAFDKLRVRLAHQQFEESRVSRRFNSINRNIQVEEVTAWSANFDFMKSFHHGIQLTYGAEGVLNQVVSNAEQENLDTGLRSDAASRYPQADWLSWGFYATGTKKFEHGLTLQAGVRYNTFAIDANFSGNSEFYPLPALTTAFQASALTGNLGLVYSANDRRTVSFNLASGFRAPNVDDIGKFFDSAPGIVVVPNPTLKAERAYNAEIGYAQIFGESIKLDFAAYYTLLDDALVRRPFALNGQDSIIYLDQLSEVQAIQNGALATVYGMQAGIEVKLGRGWNFSTKINWQRGDEELDDGTTSASRHAAPWFGLTRLDYEMGKLNLQLNARYSGGVNPDRMPFEERAKPHLYLSNADGELYAPGWYTLNFRALVKLNEFFQVTAGVENITDRRYMPYSSGLVASGRNVVMAVRMNF